MKKILIAGGAGFIGSNLSKKLLNEGNYIYCMDNLYTGRMENVSELLTNPNFKFINHDITKSINLDVDEIYNLACPASPPHYQKDPIYTANTCFNGLLNLLNLAKVNDAILLQASTSEVYGDPIIHPQVESYRGNVNPHGIRACYDEGKRIGETLCFDFNRMYNTKIKVIRIFNTYGPYMDPNDGRVVSNFIIQAIQGIDITVYGDGRQTRSFCFVDDLLDGMVRMMNHDVSFFGPVNLGNPVEFTILELADKIINLTNSKSKVIFKDLPSDDPLQRKPDITLANSKLNWAPKIMLNNGLLPTIEYFKSQLGIK